MKGNLFQSKTGEGYQHQRSREEEEIKVVRKVREWLTEFMESETGSPCTEEILGMANHPA